MDCLPSLLLTAMIAMRLLGAVQAGIGFNVRS
jgi:hypothetical protein